MVGTRKLRGITLLMVFVYVAALWRAYEEEELLVKEELTKIEKPFVFTLGGEVEAHAGLRHIPRGLEVDLVLTSGGANTDPQRAFFVPVLINMFNNAISKSRNLGKPIRERSIDVLYRSSNCDRDRDRLAGTIKQAVEQAGFVFKAAGRCGHGGWFFRGPGTPGMWTSCWDCQESKIILGFERILSNSYYLSEKAFMPYEYGAVLAYRGNGQTYLNWLGVNKESYLDRDDFASDEEYANEIVRLLKSPEKLTAMQQMPIFTDFARSEPLLRFWMEYEQVGVPKGLPHVWEFLQTNKRYQRISDRSELKLYSFKNASFMPKLARALFPNAKQWQVVDHWAKADVVNAQCCWNPDFE